MMPDQRNLTWQETERRGGVKEMEATLNRQGVPRNASCNSEKAEKEVMPKKKHIAFLLLGSSRKKLKWTFLLTFKLSLGNFFLLGRSP